MSERSYRSARAVWQRPCPLRRACARQLPQRGSHWHVGQLSSGRAKHDVPETVVLRCLGQRQLDKVRLSRSRCPLQRGPPFYAISGLMRPVKSGPACQSLSLWERWHCEAMTERASQLRQSRCEAIGRLFVRAIRSQCKSCLAASLPSQALRASSPRGRALGEGKRHLYNQKSPRHDAERAGGFSYKAEGCGNSPPWGLVS